MSEMDDKELFEIVKNINKIYAGMNVSDYIYFAKNQRHVIEALTPQMRFVQDANRYINYIRKISDSSETKADFFREWVALSEKGMYTQQKYDFDRLADILQGIVVYKTTAEFDKEAVTEAVTEEYIRNEPELSGSGSSLNETDRQEQIKGIRDWVGFWLTVIGFILTVYSLVSTKPSKTYNTAAEVNNYYINGLEINAVMLNEMSYRIVREDNVMPRIKPDCSSRVTGHLRAGQVITVSDKYRKWSEINWEDEDGKFHSGWVQNYKLMEFR